MLYSPQQEVEAVEEAVVEVVRKEEVVVRKEGEVVVEVLG